MNSKSRIASILQAASLDATVTGFPAFQLAQEIKFGYLRL